MKNCLSILLLLLTGFTRAQVGVGTTTPDASAAMDITNSGKGVLVPRMTNAQRTAISLPATGLLVYQTDGTTGFYYNSGTSAAPVWTFILNSSSGTVPTARLGSGTASSTTYLRGDGTWNTPSGGGGASIDLVATNTATQNLAISSVTTVTFNNTTTSPTVGSFNGTTYTVGATGTYLVQISLISTANAPLAPALVVNGTAVRYGTAANSSFNPNSIVSRGNLVAIMSLTSGTTLTIQGSNGSNTIIGALTTDGTTEITIVKM